MKRILLFLGLFILGPAFLSADQNQYSVKETLVPIGNVLADETFYPHSMRVSPDSKHIGYISSMRELFWVWKDGVSGKSCAGVSRQSPFFSPQQNRLAYIAQENDKMFVVIDGQEHARYKQVGTVTFSPDGSRLAYRAGDDKNRQMVVIDGQPGPIFEMGIANDVGVVFSPDSQHVAYAGLNANGSCIFVKDNKKIHSCEKIGQIKFSPDSLHVARTALEKDKWAVFLDDKKGAEYDMVSNLLFSPDGKQLVYPAKKNRRLIIVKNNEEITGDGGALHPKFSPDGKRFACLLVEKKFKCHYIINGKAELSVDKPTQLIFSDDGTSTAYAALIDNQWHMIKDGVKGTAFKKIYSYYFSPATNDIIYAAADEAGKGYIVFNDIISDPYLSTGLPVFSPDGKKYAYVARQNEMDMFMVINNEKQKPYPIIGIPMEDEAGKGDIVSQRPFFSPAGNRVAYPVYKNDTKEAFMVVDGKAHPSFDFITEPYFSPDEKHVAYMAKKGDNWHLVVNGQAGNKICSGLIKGATVVFDSPAHCYMLVVKRTDTGYSFFRLEAEIKDSKI